MTYRARVQMQLMTIPEVADRLARDGHVIGEGDRSVTSDQVFLCLQALDAAKVLPRQHIGCQWMVYGGDLATIRDHQKPPAKPLTGWSGAGR